MSYRPPPDRQRSLANGLLGFILAVVLVIGIVQVVEFVELIHLWQAVSSSLDNQLKS
jgi:hypothetical protein